MLVKLTYILVLATLIILVASLCTESNEAQAKIVNPPFSCQSAWLSAPAGQKWLAKQRCLTQQLREACRHPRPMIHGHITVKGQRANQTQLRVLTSALNAAKQRRLIRIKTYVAVVAGITQESTAYNLASGHGTSVGVLQLIDLHGSVAWRLNIKNSVNWFLNGVIPDDQAHPDLSINDLIQRQQASGHPSAYAPHVPEARRTVRAFLGPCYKLVRP